MTRQILLTCIMLLGVVFAQAQTTASTSGGEASGSGGTVSYSVGQVACQSYSSSSGTITEGVQQTYGIFTETGMENTAISLVQVSAYPNPVTDYLKLSVEMKKNENLSFQLFDMQGKILQTQKLTSSETHINMNGYVSSTYFIKIISENQSVKEFKIIKN